MTATAAVTSVRDLRYRQVDGTDLHLDLHLPADTAPRAAVAYFHGGGWRGGERTSHEATRAIALAGRGYLVATVQYRFVDAATFPAQLDDARAAVGWLREHGAEHGVTSPRVASWGASAGGHLAALLALGAEGATPDVDAGVAWFAPADLVTMSGGSPLERSMVTSSVDGLLGEPFDGSDPGHRAADPMSLVSAGAAPTLWMTGDRDRMVHGSASTRIHDALVRAGAVSRLVVIGGAGHEDPAFDDGFAVGTIAAFLDRYLAGT